MAATTTADLPPWDKANVEESQPVTGSVYEELLNKSRESLCKNLQLDDVWQHLRELGVINTISERKIKHEWVGRERVIALLDLISRGPRWRYHAFMRSVAKSGQSDLIPKGGVNLSIYENNGQQVKPFDSGQMPIPESSKPSLGPKPLTSQKPRLTLKPVSGKVPIPPPTPPKPTSPQVSIPPAMHPKATPTQVAIPPPLHAGPISIHVSNPSPTHPYVTSTQVSIPPPAHPKATSTQVSSPPPIHPYVTSTQASSPPPTQPYVTSTQASSPPPIHPYVTSTQASSPPPTQPYVTSTQASSPPPIHPYVKSTQVSSPQPTQPYVTSTQASSPPPTQPYVTSTQASSPPPIHLTAMSPQVLSPPPMHLKAAHVPSLIPAGIAQPTLPPKPTLPKSPPVQVLPPESTLPTTLTLPPRTEAVDLQPTPPLPPRLNPTSLVQRAPWRSTSVPPTSLSAPDGPPPALFPRHKSNMEKPSTQPKSMSPQVSLLPPKPPSPMSPKMSILPTTLPNPMSPHVPLLSSSPPASLPRTTFSKAPTSEISQIILPPEATLPTQSTLPPPALTETEGLDLSPTHPLPPRSIPTLCVRPVPRRLPSMRPSLPPSSVSDPATISGPPTCPYPWDKSNSEESMLVIGSVYAKLLNQSRVDLYNNLQLGCIWPHLRQLNVLKLTDEERLRATAKARPDQVLELLNFIERGPRWHYHSLMRALALTGQGHLIPRGGVGLSIYLEGVQLDKSLHVGPRPMPSTLLHGIWDHCMHCKESLMKAHIFNFESNQSELIDVSECLVDVNPHIKLELAHVNGSHVVAVPIEGTEILQEFGGTSAPRTVILFSDSGDGKTTFGKKLVFNWSVNFLNQVVNQGGTLSLKEGSQKWTTMVFLKARSITTSVEAAIRDQLGCKKADEDELMAHIQQGEGVIIVLDDLHELHDAAALEKVENYVQACQRRQGPTIVITCSTDLCSIDASFFDRLLLLKGYTEEEGLHYVKLYTEMCKVKRLSNPSQSHLVQDYVIRHKQKLKAILLNPLRLHIFCALAVKGGLDLSEHSEFNIPKLLGSLERHLLKKAGVEVNKKQSQDFYRLCIYLLVKDLKEFEDDLLTKFNVVPSYKVFLLESKDRGVGNTVLRSHYSFNNDLLLEYFSSQYIYSLDTNKRTSLLLAICSDSYLRNVQKIIFQLLLHDEGSQHALLQTMVRSMLILQSLPNVPQRGRIKDMLYQCKLWIQSKKSKRVHDDLVSLGEKIKPLTSATIENILHSKEYKIKDVNGICEKIDNAFDKNTEALKEEGWVEYINENGTFHHVVELLKLCPARLRDILVQSTVYSLMPGMFTNIYGDKTHIYPTGEARWAEVKTEGDTDIGLSVTAWCPNDAYEAILQHAPKQRRWHSQNIYLRHRTSYDNMWGEPEVGSWCKDRWDQLLQVKPDEGLRMLWILVNETVPLAGLLASLLDDVVQFPQCQIIVPYGTVRLADLVTCASGSQRRGLQLTLSSVRVVLPEGLRDQRDLLWEMIKTCKLVCQEMNWVSETGEDIKL